MTKNKNEREQNKGTSEENKIDGFVEITKISTKSL